jgi:branched-subunit amino acid aminotransferase/4-amino-4-deoxychorismate lyase
VFFVTEGEVCTPSLESGILEGVTREVVMEILRAEGIKVREALFRPADLKGAEEAFLTFTTAGVVPVQSVDGEPIGRTQAGPITTRVMEKYERQVEDATRGPSEGPGRV